MLFFFNCWAVKLFERIEDQIREEADQKARSGKVGRGPRYKSHCVTISLRPSGVNKGATTSTAPPANKK